MKGGSLPLGLHVFPPNTLHHHYRQLDAPLYRAVSEGGHAVVSFPTRRIIWGRFRTALRTAQEHRDKEIYIGFYLANIADRRPIQRTALSHIYAD